MSHLEELIASNNKILSRVLDELREIKNQSAKAQLDVDTCGSREAAALIGVNNVRYLTYFFKQRLLDRRKGGSGFLYFKSECKKLAESIKNKKVLLPVARSLYEKD